MRLYLKLHGMVLEILDPSMSAVREVSDRLSTLACKHRDSLNTEIIYSNDHETKSVIYPVTSVDSAICAIQHECEELESKMSSKLEEIKQALTSKLDDHNLSIDDSHESLRVSMKIGGFSHEFGIRVRHDLITVDGDRFSISDDKSYDLNDVDKLVNDFADLQKIVNELNQALVRSAFKSMFE